MADAREAATAAFNVVSKGIDPIEQRNAAKAKEHAATVKAKLQGTTLRHAVADFVLVKGAAWRSDKHRSEWERTVVQNFEDVIDLPVAAVTVDLVEQVLAKIWTTKTETADRVLGRICNVIDYAAAKGWRTGDAAGWDKRLRHLLPSVPAKAKRIQHFAAMPYIDMPDFMKTIPDTMPGKALKFLILTASRSSEVRGAMAGEFDLDVGIWTVPPSRMKAGREHRVMLSKQAVELVRPLLEGLTPEALVFPGEKQGALMHDMTLGRAMGDAGVTVHGFRSTIRDWIGEETEFDTVAAEQCLAHSVGSAVERAYRRGAMDGKRRGIMQAWADYATAAEHAGNVVTLKVA